MVFSDGMLTNLLDEKIICISPRPSESSVQPASIDFTLRKVYEVNDNSSFLLKELYEKAVESDDDSCFNWSRFRKLLKPLEFFGGAVVLDPRKLYYFDTVESVKLQNGIMMSAFQRSGLARLFIEATPMDEKNSKVGLNPQGRLNGTLFSYAFPIILHKNQRIFQGVFYDRSSSHFLTNPSDAIAEGLLKVKNKPTKKLYGHSLILHLSKDVLVPKKTDEPLDTQKPANIDDYFVKSSLKNTLLKYPRMFLGTTVEEVEFSQKIAGEVYFCHEFKKTCIAPFVDPGYRGRLTVTLIGGSVPYLLNGGEEILNISLHQVHGNVKNSYGKKFVKSQYQKINCVEETVSKGL